MPIPAWTAPLVAAIDGGDWDRFVAFLTEDATFRYGSQPPVSGRGAIREAASQAVAPFAKVRHELQDGWEAPGSCILEGRVNYHLPDGTVHTLPFVNLFRMDGALIRDYLIYIDPTPLFFGTRKPPRIAGYAGVARAPFLVLPLMLVASGAAAQAFAGAFSWLNTILAFIGLLMLHIVVNVRNEVSDFQRGIDLVTERTPFSGGSGALPGGLIGPREASLFGWLALAVAGAIGVYFIFQVGEPIVPIMLAGLVAVLFYTPVFTSIGIGEIAAGAGLGFLPVLGTAVVQGGDVTSAAMAAAIPAFFMTFNLLLLNEFPDEAADRAGGRRNLVLLLGRRGAARIWLAAVVGEAASLVIAVAIGVMPAWCLLALLPLLALGPAVKWAATAPESPVPIPALGGNVIWNLATNALVAIGFGLAMLLA